MVQRATYAECCSVLGRSMAMNSINLLACVLALLVAAASAGVPAPALRLRGGGIISTLGDKLGWKREKVGPNELGCGPLPQVKPVDRHTKEGEKMKKQHNGDGYTRSHSFLIPDVAGQR